MFQRTTISACPTFVHVITRFIQTETCAGVHSTVITITTVAILSPRRYEQVFTRFHAQTIGSGQGVRRQGKMGCQYRFQISTLYSVHELRGYG